MITRIAGRFYIVAKRVSIACPRVSARLPEECLEVVGADPPLFGLADLVRKQQPIIISQPRAQYVGRLGVRGKRYLFYRRMRSFTTNA